MIVARRMIMNNSHLGSTLQQSFPQYRTHIYQCAGNTARTDPDPVYHLIRLIHQQYPKLFQFKIAHQRMKQFVNIFRTTDNSPLLHFLQFTTLSQFQSSHNGNAFRRAEAFKTRKVTDSPMSQFVQIIMTGDKYPSHQLYRALFGIAGADQNSQQLGIAQGARTFQHHFLSRTILFRPLANSQFVCIFHWYVYICTFIYKSSFEKLRTHLASKCNVATKLSRNRFHNRSVV